MEKTNEKKSRYERPALTAFGSVRNLTGGSGGTTTGDSTTMDMF
ncbi:lasso RiPP family leader peptide-containing protein [Aurantiacibacter marinus]|nr:lasso RiPP family leader peptide-containing protein [Aurantiacibacter marinus]